MRFPLLPALAALAVAGCGGHGSSGPNLIEGPPSVVQQQALAAVNVFRVQAGVPALTANAALNTAASRHAGYLTLRASGYSHFETVDGSAGGVPDTTNGLYTAVLPDDRARSANGGTDVATGASYDESTCSIGGQTSIHWLWYTVYHRMPLARYEAQLAGFGDQNTALGTFPTSGVPVGTGYSVLLLAGVPPVGAVASSWPPNGTLDVERQISTDAETPDPFSATTTGQTPATPSIDLVGPPLHVILPTSSDWASVSVTLNAQPVGGPAGTEENLYIFCGGTAPPTTFPAYATVILDDPSRLRQGEMVIVPAVPLQPNMTYAWTLTATTTAAPTPETVTVGSPTAWTFRTGP
jgi:hypothetical protein